MARLSSLLLHSLESPALWRFGLYHANCPFGLRLPLQARGTSGNLSVRQEPLLIPAWIVPRRLTKAKPNGPSRPVVVSGPDFERCARFKGSSTES